MRTTNTGTRLQIDAHSAKAPGTEEWHAQSAEVQDLNLHTGHRYMGNTKQTPDGPCDLPTMHLRHVYTANGH